MDLNFLKSVSGHNAILDEESDETLYFWQVAVEGEDYINGWDEGDWEDWANNWESDLLFLKTHPPSVDAAQGFTASRKIINACNSEH